MALKSKSRNPTKNINKIMIKYNKKDIKKILLIKNDKIGDMIVSSNVFREIRKAFPEAKITAIVSKSNKFLIEKSPYVDNIHILNSSPKGYKEIKEYWEMSSKLRKEHFDLGIDLRGSIYNIFFLLYLAGVKKRIGFYHQKLSGLFLHYGLTKDRYSGKHCVPLRLELLNKALGINAKNYWPEINVDRKDNQILKNFLKENKIRKYIVFVPDASYEKKQWALEKWNQLIKDIQREFSEYKLVLTGGDMNKLNYLLGRNPKLILPEPELNNNLRAVYLLLKNSSLVVAHDGGLMHLSWASKAPTIAIMADFLPVEYLKPLGKKATTIKANIRELSVEKVFNAVNNSLRSN